MAQEAAHLPVVHTSAELVLHLHPDLILAATYGAQTTLGLLEQEGTPILRVDLPQDFDGIRSQTRLLARVLGVPQRGETLLGAMDAALGGLPQRPRELRALVWEPRGLTAGPGSLMDAVLRSQVSSTRPTVAAWGWRRFCGSHPISSSCLRRRSSPR